MPNVRRGPGSGDELQPAMRWFLVHGDLPRHDEEPAGWVRGFGSGKFDASLLWGHWLRWSMCPAAWPHLAHVVDDIAALWAAHEPEIRAATPEGEEPWALWAIQEAERIISGTHEDEDDEDDDEEEDPR